MFKRALILAVLAGLLAASAPAWTYDTELAESYALLFQPVVGAKAGKALHLMTPEVFVARIKSGEPLVTLDVRTPAETSVFTSAVPGGLTIPMNELFTSKNLARIPTDTPVVVLCASGIRATAAGTALRHIGFDNVFILKGGFKTLSSYVDPKTANAPPVGGKGK